MLSLVSKYDQPAAFSDPRAATSVATRIGLDPDLKAAKACRVLEPKRRKKKSFQGGKMSKKEISFLTSIFPCIQHWILLEKSSKTNVLDSGFQQRWPPLALSACGRHGSPLRRRCAGDGDGKSEERSEMKTEKERKWGRTTKWHGKLAKALKHLFSRESYTCHQTSILRVSEGTLVEFSMRNFGMLKNVKNRKWKNVKKEHEAKL